MNSETTMTVKEDEADTRLDRWFHRHFSDVPHAMLEKLLRTGQIMLDGGKVKSNYRVIPGQTVRIPHQVLSLEKKDLRKESRKISDDDARMLRDAVLYRDDDVIVLNKPAGLAVQGGTGIDRNLDAMLDALSFDSEQRPRLVHRLDKDTSGVLLLGRTATATARMAASFRSRAARKCYWALVVGIPIHPQGRIDAPLGKMAGKNGDRVAVDEEDGRRAVTYYRVIDKALHKAAWLELEPRTGRTHQLRVHCAILGTPIQGDGKYGGQNAYLSGYGLSRKLHLHARAISLPHPRYGQIEIIAPPPEHLISSFDFFGFAMSEAGKPFVAFNGEEGERLE